MTRKNLILAVAGIAVGSTAVLVAPDAEAIIPHPWRSSHASTCMVQSGTVFTSIPDAQMANGFSNHLWLVCPVDGDNNLNFKTAGVQAEVTGWANNGGTWGAEACVTYGSGGGGGGACGPQSVQVGGVRHANLNLSAWNGAGLDDFPFIRVQLGPVHQGSTNVVWGIRLYK